MSVTFEMPQAPVERYQPEPIDDPEWFSIRPVAPFTSINLNESNAKALMLKIDPASVYEDGAYGEWDGEKLNVIYRRIMKLMNSDKQESLYIDPFIDKAPGRCTVYYGGRDADYVARVLPCFLELVNVARQHGFSVLFG
jgi:hypothetical protein